MKSKIVSIDEAMKGIFDGISIMIPGFQDVGAPIGLINEIDRRKISNLTLISTDAGSNKRNGIGTLICNERVKKIITSHIGLNPVAGDLMREGKLDVTLIPMGTFVERIRCGGYGLGGVLTSTGVGTVVEEGKQIIRVKGKEYLLEEPIKADVAILKAWKADKIGNLVYHRCARNYNPIMAMAADLVIVEAENIVEVGELDPDEVVTPGVCVDMIVQL